MSGKALVALALTGVVLTGCSVEDSCLIGTNGIYCDFVVLEEGDQATVRATFWVGDKPLGTCLYLGDCGDEIRVNGAPMLHQEDVYTYYETVIAKGDTYEFVFTREGEGEYVSAATVPSVAITAPAEGDVVSRAGGILVQWDEADTASDQEAVTVQGACVVGYYQGLIEGTEYWIEPEKLVAPEDPEAPDTCTATVSVYRERAGDLDPGLTGRITATAIDRVAITLTP
ncbi:MAG TPA: hypothetical protein PLO37_04910 [Candidatus Hydrogenedentes bacterium]|nr:hypothetical protein [Candidatus Hydrogenedentota bacterium]HPG66165.1 hypothetical protein [Candidatus Hydrogenedentota bacterium]